VSDGVGLVRVELRDAPRAERARQMFVERIGKRRELRMHGWELAKGR
jgi:hypothetical protein